ncbi:MAG: exodeoxyribonuclease VII large subunit [Gaiellales bacterium]
MGPEPIVYGDRKVYTVAAFNDGVASWIGRLPLLWVEGEVTGLRRQPGWSMVFFTLRDPERPCTLEACIPRGAFDALEHPIEDGTHVHVHGRAEVWVSRGELRLKAVTIEPVGEGALLARLERLRRALAAEGLFAAERKRPLPELPARIGLVTGSEAAAKQDVITAISNRFPPARILVTETYVQGPRAPASIVAAIEAISPIVDVVILARGGGSFRDLLPFSDERVVRAVAACPVPIVSAVGHEQDTPLCDLAADARASTPTAAARLVVPDRHELAERLDRARDRLGGALARRLAEAGNALERDRLRLLRAPTVLLERARASILAAGDRLLRAPAVLLERRTHEVDVLAGRLRALAPGATLARGYAIVARDGEILRDARDVREGERIEVRLAAGELGARVEDVRP